MNKYPDNRTCPYCKVDLWEADNPEDWDEENGCCVDCTAEGKPCGDEK